MIDKNQLKKDLIKNMVSLKKGAKELELSMIKKKNQENTENFKNNNHNARPAE